MSKLEKLSFNDVLKWHALAAGPAGLVLVMLPHRLFAQLSGAPYSPAAHEVARCYGALTAAHALRSASMDTALGCQSGGDGREFFFSAVSTA